MTNREIKRAIEKINFQSPRTKIDFFVALSNETNLPIRKLVDMQVVIDAVSNRAFPTDPLGPRSTGGCFKPDPVAPTPWLAPTHSRNKLTNARVTLKFPFNPDGSETVYFKIAKLIGLGLNTKHRIATQLGLAPKETRVWGYSKSEDRYVPKGVKLYYSYNSYYTALSTCEIIKYDRKTRTWGIGKNYDSFMKYADNCLLFNGVKIK